MKLSQLFPVLLVTCLALVGCQGSSSTSIVPPTTETSDTAVSDDLKPDLVEIVIDVRSKEEWDSGHLKQAILIPHTEIAEKIGDVTLDKSAKIVLY